ncbi:MAG: protein translocase subunit SecF [Candidatus Cloacimonetes bacterium]|nr:protein translocase subunit SecF [Candidatus Cloacimonadota bacterium]
MKFFKETKIDFIGKRKIAFIVSMVFIVVGIISLVINKGPKYGIDFNGGVSLELNMTPLNENANSIPPQEIRDVLDRDGISDVNIQEISDSEGKELVLIKTQITETNGVKITDRIKTSLRKNFPNNASSSDSLFIRLQEEVGPSIGSELKGKAFLAIFWSLFGIILYIWWRFQFTYGIVAVIALFHDILITIGLFSIFGKEIGLTIVAALLTIVGYSLNDTIVVFDRIREDLKVYRRESYGSVINHSINETLSRTVITSLTTFIVVLSLYLFGGTVIHDFAFAILIGIIVGTYSSIFVASPLLVEYFSRTKDKTRKK